MTPASRFGPARPRAIGWNGAGVCVMLSQARQESFSRTVWITLKLRGTHSSVSVTLSPSLASLPPQHGQAEGLGRTTRSRGRCAGSGPRIGLARAKARTFVSPGAGSASAASSSATAVSSSSSCSSIWSSSLPPRSDEAPNRSRRILAMISL